MIKINGDDLATVTKNAMMFCNPKSIYLPGEILFDLTDNTLKVYACDDYFAVCSQAPFTGNADIFFVLSLTDVKTLEEFSRKNKKDEILISIAANGNIALSTNDDTKAFEVGEFREDNWYIVEGLIFDPSVTPVWIQEFDSNPERYAKLSQLKYNKNEHWIKWRFVETQTGNLLIRFSVGPNLNGVIRPLSEPEKHVQRNSSAPDTKNKETNDRTDSETPVSLSD